MKKINVLSAIAVLSLIVITLVSFGKKHTTEYFPQTKELNGIEADYIMVNFWASHNANSLDRTIELSSVLKDCEKQLNFKGVKLHSVAVSFDNYNSVYEKTVEQNDFVYSQSINVSDGFKSPIAKVLNLTDYNNYLIDKNGRILIKNFSAEELQEYIHNL